MGAAGAGVVTGGVGLLSSKMQADAMVAQGEWSARQTEFNRAMSVVERAEIDKKSQDDVVIRQKDVSSMLGIQKATMAANGIDVESDVSIQIQEDTKRIGREDVRAIKDNAWRTAWGMKVKEADMTMQAGFSRAGAYTNAANTIATAGLQGIASVTKGAADDNRSNTPKR